MGWVDLEYIWLVGWSLSVGICFELLDRGSFAHATYGFT